MTLAVLAACSGEGAEPEERGSAAARSPTAGRPSDRCAAVSDAELSSWTGESLEVGDDGPDGCVSVAEGLGPLRADWAFKASTGSQGRDVSRESLGFDETRVELGGGVTAVISSGVVGGVPQALAVVPDSGPRADEVLVVNVVNNPGTARVPRPRLVEIATRIAAAYAE